MAGAGVGPAAAVLNVAGAAPPGPPVPHRAEPFLPPVRLLRQAGCGWARHLVLPTLTLSYTELAWLLAAVNSADWRSSLLLDWPRDAPPDPAHSPVNTVYTGHWLVQINVN